MKRNPQDKTLFDRILLSMNLWVRENRKNNTFLKFYQAIKNLKLEDDTNLIVKRIKENKDLSEEEKDEQIADVQFQAALQMYFILESMGDTTRLQKSNQEGLTDDDFEGPDVVTDEELDESLDDDSKDESEDDSDEDLEKESSDFINGLDILKKALKFYLKPSPWTAIIKGMIPTVAGLGIASLGGIEIYKALKSKGSSILDEEFIAADPGTYKSVMEASEGDVKYRSLISSVQDYGDEVPVVNSVWGAKESFRKGPHGGVDIKSYSSTRDYDAVSPVVGKVTKIWKASGGGGWSIEITSGNYKIHFMHLATDAVTDFKSSSYCYVKEGDKVVPGTKLARTGSSGNVTGKHLHIQVINSGKYVNPETLAVSETGKIVNNTYLKTKLPENNESGEKPKYKESLNKQISQEYKISKSKSFKYKKVSSVSESYDELSYETATFKSIDKKYESLNLIGTSGQASQGNLTGITSDPVNRWEGDLKNQGRWPKWETPAASVRATFKAFRSYAKKGLDTIREVLYKYSAPGVSENKGMDYDKYIKGVTKKANEALKDMGYTIQLTPDTEIDITEPHISIALAKGIAFMESTSDLTTEYVKDVYEATYSTPVKIGYQTKKAVTQVKQYNTFYSRKNNVNITK